MDSEAQALASAFQSFMDHQVRRSHSPPELEQKLATKHSADSIFRALDEASKHGWMEAPEELANRLFDEFAHKFRRFLFIERELTERGLPVPQRDDLKEAAKARTFADSKLAHPGPYDYQERGKLSRCLAARGSAEDNIPCVVGVSDEMPVQ